MGFVYVMLEDAKTEMWNAWNNKENICRLVIEIIEESQKWVGRSASFDSLSSNPFYLYKDIVA